jgi:Family of unknown function (DUF6152)
MTRRVSFLIALTFLSVTTAYAHHSTDLRNATPIRVEGDIEFVSWDGAHVVYDIRGTDADGESRTWAVMGASPKILRSRGIAKSTFKVGDRITVSGLFDPYTRFIAPDVFITANSTQYKMGLYPMPMIRR